MECAFTLKEAASSLKILRDGEKLFSEADLRAFTRRKSCPLPCIKKGVKRPHVYVFESVLIEFLAFEMGVVPYAAVEQAARRIFSCKPQ